jgi:hypothetical protein
MYVVGRCGEICPCPPSSPRLEGHVQGNGEAKKKERREVVKVMTLSSLKTALMMRTRKHCSSDSSSTQDLVKLEC